MTKYENVVCFLALMNNKKLSLTYHKYEEDQENVGKKVDWPKHPVGLVHCQEVKITQHHSGLEVIGLKDRAVA